MPLTAKSIYRATVHFKQVHPLFLARISAGFPSPADDYIEKSLDLNEHLIKHPAATFFVRVEGSSMINAGIHNGDILKLTPKIREKFLKKNEEYASTGCRVLGLAFKEHLHSSLEIKHVESELVFVGLVSIRDPPDKLTIESVKKCKEAGIKVVMITGDNEITAKTIATEIGIFSPGDTLLTGTQLENLSDEEF